MTNARTIALLLGLGWFTPAFGQATQRAYNWQGWGRFYLSAPFFPKWGLADVLPFGFRPTSRSQLRFTAASEVRQQSYFLPSSNPELFDSVQYSLADGAVSEVTLKATAPTAAGRWRVREALRSYFGEADFANRQEVVFSNEKLLAVLNLPTQSLVVRSLDHQPLSEQVVAGYRFYKEAGKFWYSVSESEAVGLEFYNQLTRENNVQLAFRLHWRGAAPVGMRQVRFQLVNGRHLILAVEADQAAGLEKVSRCYLYEEEAQALYASPVVRVTLRGRRSVSYQLPAYQKHSLKAALQFYKENVTNPLVIYNGW